MSSDLLDEYFTFEQLGKKIHRHPRTILRWSNEPDGLPFTKLGKTRLTTPEWFNAWLASRMRQPNPDRRRRKRER
jgi:hypothetical protein